MKIEFLYFEDCPNHRDARRILEDVLRKRQVSQAIEDVNATDVAVAEQHRFPGSPTIRIEGADVEPNFVDPGDYTPRCRLYPSAEGLKGLPEKKWIEDAIDRALGDARQK